MNSLVLSVALLGCMVVYCNAAIQSDVNKVCNPKSNFTCQINKRPVIGILSQTSTISAHNGTNTTYIAASYVKWVESGGAMVVPIIAGRDESYYRDLLSKINGVLFPGGASGAKTGSPYDLATSIMYNIAKEYNDNGDYFPIWGICLYLAMIEAGNRRARTPCEGKYKTLRQYFLPDSWNTSRMYQEMPRDLVIKLHYENISNHNHGWCVTPQRMEEYDLDKFYRPLTVGWAGKVAISSFEAFKYPFYGLQFHPEKANYEWTPKWPYNHGADAIRASNYYAWFFAKEARKNGHFFNSEDEHDDALIYQYPTTFTGARASASFEQKYYFTPK